MPTLRRALLVVGMHRSGTSALARTLNLVGGALGGNLAEGVAGDDDLGFWEPLDVAALHDRALASAGSTWDDVSRFPQDWFASDVARSIADELLSLLRRDLADAPLFAIKDPRLCRLVPLWLAVLPRLEARAQFILLLRNPAEVAASLKARNDFPLAKGYLVWLRNVLDAEQATRGQERVFVTYEGLLQDWRGVVNRIGEALGMHWPPLSRTAEAEIEDFLSPGLRRERADWAEVRQRGEVPGWVVRVYDSLLRLASSDPGDDPGAEAELDAVREELDGADATYGRALAGMGFRIDKGVEQLQAAEVALARATAARDAYSREADRERTQHQEVLVERDAQLAELKRVVSVREGQVRDLTQSLRDYDDAQNRNAAHLGSTIDDLRRRLEALEQSTFWRATAPLRWSVDQLKGVGLRVKAAPTRLPRAAAHARGIVAKEGVRGLIDVIRRRAQVRREGLTSEPPPDIYRAESEIRALEIPSHPEPEVTIVVPTYGQHRVTFTCLKSIADNTGALAYEVLLVDDHYPEPAAEALAAVTGLRIVTNDENLGFLRSCNRAAAQARGRYLVLLNNDTLVLPGWLDALLRTAKDGADVGAVGAQLIYPNGLLQEAGGIVWKDGSAWTWGRGEDPEDPRFQYVRQVDYCSAACLLVPKVLFDEIGGFDDRYAPAYYEDTDLCFAIRARGKRVLYQPAAQVVHFEGTSHGTDETSGVKAYQVRNRDIFRDKWAVQLSSYLNTAVMPERERDRGVKHRVLWVDACMLMPDQDSGSLRARCLLQILQEFGCKVAFVADNLEHPQPYTHDLQQLGIEVLHGPYLSSVKSYLRSHAHEHDVIVLSRHYIAKHYVGLIRKVAPNARIVFDTVDLHFLRLRRQAELDGQDASRKAADIAFREEVGIVAKSDATLVVSSDEANVLAREAPQAHVHIVSNVHAPVDSVAPAAGRRDLLFVGGFRHPPNVDAVEYYASEIWPLFHQRHPQARTLVVGSRMPDSLRRLGESVGLDMLGFVPDLSELLRAVRFSVCPLRYGAGVKGKINQSMSYGLPVVATPVSVEGMFLTDGQDVLLADNAVAFADAMSRLYTDDALWERLSSKGQENVSKHFSFAQARQALVGLFRDLGLEADEALWPQQ